MKNIEYWLNTALVGMLLLPLANCSKAEKEVVTDTKELFSSLTVSKSNLNIEGSSFETFEIKTSTGWRIDISDNVSSWLEVSPIEGSGNAKITCKTDIPLYRETFKTKLDIINKMANTSTPVSVTCIPQNTAPSAPINAIYPSDGETNFKDSFFRLNWEPASDAEKDKLNYDVYYSMDNINWTQLGKKIEINQYTADISLKENTKYYWKVQAFDLYGATSPESKVFTFTTASSFGSWEDGEVLLYQPCIYESATDPFTLIVTGDGFTADAFTSGGVWDQISQRAIQSLLSDMEPYKTWGNYLRIIRIAAYSEESGISEHKSTSETLRTVKTKFNSCYDNLSNSAWTGLANTNDGSNIFDWCLEQTTRAGYNINKNYSVVVLQNVAHYNGTVYQYMGSKRTLGFVCLSPGKKGTKTGFENVFCHEIGGHAIGHLADLYISSSGSLPTDKINETKSMQSRGWYMNVSIVNSKTECPWSIFFTSREKDNYYPQVGLFEGARSYKYGIWRPEDEPTCMNDNRFLLDAPSRYLIVKQLVECVGESLTWESFVTKDYDRSNSVFNSTRAVYFEDPTIPALHEPIIINP